MNGIRFLYVMPQTQSTLITYSVHVHQVMPKTLILYKLLAGVLWPIWLLAWLVMQLLIKLLYLDTQK